jgi:RimJ/RimL family protein N-acetyltransferase
MKLETERLILRKPRMSDIKDIHSIINDINIAKNVASMPFPYSFSECKKYYGKAIKEWGEKECLFAIELKSIKKVIGFMGFHKINKFSGTAETGSWIGGKYQRKGYMTEAKIALNEFAFKKLKLQKLISPVFVENKASNATQKRIGYKLEGKLKRETRCLATGKMHDENLYALFKEDWKKSLPKVKKHLKEKIKKLGSKK